MIYISESCDGNQDEKLRKEEAKEEAKERRKVEHEKNKWEKGKFALQNTWALIDTKVVEKGAIGGQFLSLKVPIS